MVIQKQVNKSRNKKYIGIVLHSYPNNSETFFLNKFKCLNDLGFRVTIFVDQKEDTDIANCINGFSWSGDRKNKVWQLIKAVVRLLGSPIKTVILLYRNSQSGYKAFFNFVSVLRSSHIFCYDLDWLHFGFATCALGRENLASLIGAKMSTSIRGYDIAIYPKLNLGCYTLLWKKLDKLHYISDDLLNIAKKEGFNIQIKHKKIPPCIDTKFFSGHQRIEISKPLKIITNARLHWKKGYEYIFKALAILKQNSVPFKYTIIGQGDQFERLIYATHQLKLYEHICFVGIQSKKEVKSLLEENDIFILYSIQEGFSNAVLEAQSMGLLSIVSDSEGLNENVLNGISGWIIPKLSPSILAERLISIFSLKSEIVKQMSNNAIQHVNQKHGLRQLKAGFKDFYR